MPLRCVDEFIEEDIDRYAGQDDQPDTEYILCLDSHNIVYPIIGGIKQGFVLDTGVKSNVIPRTVWKVLVERGIKVYNQTRDCDQTFRAYASSQPMKATGSFNDRKGAFCANDELYSERKNTDVEGNPR